VLRALRLAGDVVRQALKYAIDLAQPGTPVLEICERVEKLIRGSGAKPAFPVNVGVNEVAAHYTAKRNDVLMVPRVGVVKIDVGVQRDGYIVDAAVTVALGSPFEGLVRAAREALRVALEAARPGVKAWQIGMAIERAAKRFGFRPVYNLTGHRIERYTIHAGDVVPNYPDTSASQALKPGDIYAIEPFVTNGEGFVTERGEITIYRLTQTRRKEFRRLIDIVRAEAGPLPFSPRWFPQIDDADIAAAHRAGVLHGYEVLVERSGGFVAQFEETVYVDEDSVILLADTLELL